MCTHACVDIHTFGIYPNIHIELILVHLFCVMFLCLVCCSLNSYIITSTLCISSAHQSNTQWAVKPHITMHWRCCMCHPHLPVIVYNLFMKQTTWEMHERLPRGNNLHQCRHQSHGGIMCNNTA